MGPEALVPQYSSVNINCFTRNGKKGSHATGRSRKQMLLGVGRNKYKTYPQLNSNIPKMLCIHVHENCIFVCDATIKKVTRGLIHFPQTQELQDSYDEA